ncbi:MAG: ATP-binding cassette domain-containing protein, partial [Gemmataceae bacterium]
MAIELEARNYRVLRRTTWSPSGVCVVVGPNGSGKTTLINLLGGALAPSSGKIYLEGQDITGLSADVRVLRGLTRTFQI